MTTTAPLTHKELVSIYNHTAPLAGPDFLEFDLDSLPKLLDESIIHWESHPKCGPCLRVLRDLLNGNRFNLCRWETGEVVGQASVEESLEGLHGWDKFHASHYRGSRIGVIGIGSCYVDFN